jgi:sugar-phosphatase
VTEDESGRPDLSSRALDGMLLDMDGTLVDSDGAVARAWTTWAAEIGFDISEFGVGAPGLPAIAAIRLMRPGGSAGEAELHAERVLELQYDDLSDVGPTAGARRLIAVMESSGMPWAVVTSADRRLALARLGAAKIEAPVLVTVEEVAAGKPDPSGYLIGADRLGVAPAHCLVVEDSAAGLAAGRAAGARTAGLRGLESDLAITDLNELADLLEADRREGRPITA